MQMKEIELLVILFAASQIPIQTETVVFYVISDNLSNSSCLSQPCARLSQYLLDNNGTLPVVSNVEYHFLPGEHHLPTRMVLEHLNNFMLIGIISASPVTSVSCPYHSFLHIKNSSNFTIDNVNFRQCKMCYEDISYEDIVGFQIATCHSCNFKL